MRRFRFHHSDPVWTHFIYLFIFFLFPAALNTPLVFEKIRGDCWLLRSELRAYSSAFGARKGGLQRAENAPQILPVALVFWGVGYPGPAVLLGGVCAEMGVALNTSF